MSGWGQHPLLEMTLQYTSFLPSGPRPSDKVCLVLIVGCPHCPPAKGRGEGRASALTLFRLPSPSQGQLDFSPTFLLRSPTQPGNNSVRSGMRKAP